jgi:hypothetical protein
MCVAMGTLTAYAQAGLGGTWNGAVLEARSNCTHPENSGNHGTYAQYDIGIGGGTISIAMYGITGLQCTYSGSYSQSGADQQASGTFSCNDFKQGTWNATGFLVTENEMSLKLSEQLMSTETCSISAIFGGSRLSATMPPLPSIDYTGGWYNASESGWGVSIVKGASNLLGVIIYNFDQNNAPTWFILLDGSWRDTTTFAGTLYRYTGPVYSGAFNPALVARAPVGNATIAFASGTSASLNYTINGVAQTKAITKLSF